MSSHLMRYTNIGYIWEWKIKTNRADRIRDRTTGNLWFYFRDRYAEKDIRDYCKPLKVAAI